MSVIRYLLDENVAPVLRTELLRREPGMDVWRVGDPGAPGTGTLDPAILEWCEENAFILVTGNRKSMPRHLQERLTQSRHVPGILLLSPNMRMGAIIDDLLVIWGASDLGEYRDTILYLPLS